MVDQLKICDEYVDISTSKAATTTGIRSFCILSLHQLAIVTCDCKLATICFALHVGFSGAVSAILITDNALDAVVSFLVCIFQ